MGDDTRNLDYWVTLRSYVVSKYQLIDLLVIRFWGYGCRSTRLLRFILISYTSGHSNLVFLDVKFWFWSSLLTARISIAINRWISLFCRISLISSEPKSKFIPAPVQGLIIIRRYWTGSELVKQIDGLGWTLFQILIIKKNVLHPIFFNFSQ